MNSNKQQKTSLNAQASRLVGFINPQEKTPLTGQKAQLQAYSKTLLAYNGFSFVSTAIHDQDLNDTGETKTMHLHFFIETKQEGLTLSHWLREMCELLGVAKDQVTIGTSNSEYLMVQYLTHKNAPEKHQYSPAIIETTDQEELTRRYHQEYEEPKDPLQEALMNCQTLTELLGELGPKTTNQFRGLFKDLHQERLQEIAYHELETRYMEMKRFLNDLFQSLMLFNGRLNEFKWWLDRAEELDILDINDITPKTK